MSRKLDELEDEFAHLHAVLKEDYEEIDMLFKQLVDKIEETYKKEVKISSKSKLENNIAAAFEALLRYFESKVGMNTTLNGYVMFVRQVLFYYLSPLLLLKTEAKVRDIQRKAKEEYE